MTFSYCRPVRIAFEKENLESVNKEFERVNNEINNLNSIYNSNQNIRIFYELLPTMVDVSTISKLTKTKSPVRSHLFF